MNRLLRNRAYPVDWLIIGYGLLMVALILILGRPLGQYVDELLFYGGIVVVAILIVRFIGERQGRVFRFFRLLYPALLFTGFYRMTGGLMFLVHDRFLDYQLTAWEQSILGFEPSLYIDRYLLNTWLTEIFMGTYFSYYFMVPGLLILLFVLKKYDMIRQALAAICLTFFVSYMLFFLYPIEGPRWHYMDNYLHRVEGPFFRQLVEYVQANGSVRGGCVPSTHVAVAVIVMIFSFRISRPLGWTLACVNIGMAIGTVWGRYHYASDAIIGTAIALAAVWLVNRYHPVYEPEAALNVDNPRVRVHNVT